MIRGATEPGLQRQPMGPEGVSDLQPRSKEAGEAVASVTVKGPAAKEASKRGEGARLNVGGAIPRVEEGLARGHEASEEGNGEEPHATPHAKPTVARRQSHAPPQQRVRADGRGHVRGHGTVNGAVKGGGGRQDGVGAGAAAQAVVPKVLQAGVSERMKRTR